MANRIVEKVKKIKWRIEDFCFIRKSNLHAVWEQQQLSNIFRNFGVDYVFDVGANHGQYATMLRKRCGY